MSEIKRDPDLEWLDHVRAVGLVVAPVLLKEFGLLPERQTQADTARVAALIGEDDDKPALADPWPFMRDVLGWRTENVAGSQGGPELPSDLNVRLPEQSTTLSPTWAVKELGDTGKPWQLLVRIEPAGVDPDARGTADGWEATAHQRFERLLRESGVFAGVLISERSEKKDGTERFIPELRLVYAPKGESSGYATFPLRDLRSVAGRPMLGGLKLLLDSMRLFTDATDRRLPALLDKSREAQTAVSTELAAQVLGALHELLRGLDTAAPDLVRELAREKPAHLYEGLLTVLMRLVFVLYAEDRDLLPSRTDGRSLAVYEVGYSLRGLYERLMRDAALNPDTMDERRGAWGQLLALFRLIHSGHPSKFIQARGGKLFDPAQFAFLEGRPELSAIPVVLPVSDGCVLRILEGLMTLAIKGGTRERLSYRTLDVEQIGSVYETVMGFSAEVTQNRSLAIRAGKNNRTPVFVNLEKLASLKGKERLKYLKEDADRSQLSAGISKAVEAAKNAGELAAALDPIVDERGSPNKHDLPAGTPILQPTDERRRTGSHYTPRTLTAPIVEHALEPAFGRLGLDATPEQILNLKVCDPAMGSGAFLVEACRALATRLIQAWERYPEKKPKNIPADEDENLHAKRLVVQRCIYGVDKNPLATDLAKLSLWLATLARDHEFTFLDHALKTGDSLIGLTREQIEAAHWDLSMESAPLLRGLLRERVNEVAVDRLEIQAAPDDVARALQEGRHRAVETKLESLRLYGDAIVAAFFSAGKPRSREAARVEVAKLIAGIGTEGDRTKKLQKIAADLKHSARPITPFHWEIEFPEVFTDGHGGFDAIIGNPPFMRGKAVGTSLGTFYRDWLKTDYPLSNASADLVALFFRRAFQLLRIGGAMGLIATKTISEGDTRRAGLRYICNNNGIIYRADRRVRWPGEAAVLVSKVHIVKGQWHGDIYLDGSLSDTITAFFFKHGGHEDPHKLAANSNISFNGCAIAGVGFTFDDHEARATSIAEMRSLIETNPSNAERIFPFIGGDEINGSPTHRPARYIIYFNGMSLDEASRWPDLEAIVRAKVKPERDNANRAAHRTRWWQFGDWRPGLFEAISRKERMLCVVFISQHLGLVWMPTDHIVSHNVGVFASDRDEFFCIVQSRTHEFFATRLSSGLEERPGYRPSDGFEPFPFPLDFHSNTSLADAGRQYYSHRAQLMVSRGEGLTKTYNRFHSPTETAEDIQRLRDLHAAMDRAVLEAYGWHDLADRAAPIFLDEANEDDQTYQGRLFWPSNFRDEVVTRLLALNAERHAEEVRLGIAPGGVAGTGEEDADVD